MSEPLPLFPLNAVLFPGVVMPLHIFEPRYRSLVRDLIALPPGAAREFGIVAIKVGYEVGERGVHTIQRTGCAALVTEVTANPDGTFELVIVGRRRFHVEQLDASQDYLRADVQWLVDSEDGATAHDIEAATQTARIVFEHYREVVRELRGDDILEGETPDTPTDLSYTLAAALILGLAERQSLLETPDVLTRLRLGTTMMRTELRSIAAVPSLPATSLARTRWSPN